MFSGEKPFLYKNENRWMFGLHCLQTSRANFQYMFSVNRCYNLYIFFFYVSSDTNINSKCLQEELKGKSNLLYNENRY